MASSDGYIDDLRMVRSLLIVTSLQKRRDLKARQLIEEFKGELVWEPVADLMIDQTVWDYAVRAQEYDPKLVFCHPDVLVCSPAASLYYRGLCGLSLKAIRDYAGAVESVEEGRQLSGDKALRLARTYNTFICSIVKNSTEWTLENGYCTIIATLGITLDGVMRNKVGTIAEERIRTLIVEWLIRRGLVVEPSLSLDEILESVPTLCTLQGGLNMKFGSDPDVAFRQGAIYRAVIEIKGGIDPAGALERYGAATKSFQHAIRQNPHCRNFYLAAVFTPELERRIDEDRLVDQRFDIIPILEDEAYREDFFNELFHHTLRLI